MLRRQSSRMAPASATWAPISKASGTLNHLLVADWLWLSRMTGEPNAVISLDQELYTDFDELARARSPPMTALTGLSPA